MLIISLSNIFRHVNDYRSQFTNLGLQNIYTSAVSLNHFQFGPSHFIYEWWYTSVSLRVLKDSEKLIRCHYGQRRQQHWTNTCCLLKPGGSLLQHYPWDRKASQLGKPQCTASSLSRDTIHMHLSQLWPPLQVLPGRAQGYSWPSFQVMERKVLSSLFTL